MTEYSLTTVWHFEAPIDEVWDAMSHSERWPEWWPYVAEVRVLKTGNRDGLNEVRRFHWRTCLPYTLTFDLLATRVDPCVVIETDVSGDLVGHGRCCFSSDADLTRLDYQWNVRTHVDWMNRFAPVAKPLFEWNHRRVMQAGREGLARRLALRMEPSQAVRE